MAAPMNDFPKWNPVFKVRQKIRSDVFSIRYNALRTSSSGFVKKANVRNRIFTEKGNKCYLCGKEATQIDHKRSVYDYAIDKNDEYCVNLNSFDNLFPICKKCNTSKPSKSEV